MHPRVQSVRLADGAVDDLPAGGAHALAQRVKFRDAALRAEPGRRRPALVLLTALLA